MSMKKSTVKILMKILLWILRHIYIQSKNLNENKDKFRENDETKPVSASEIGIKIDF